MSERVEALHAQMSALSLGDVLALASQAMAAGLDDKRVDLILKYVEMKMAERRIAKAKR